MKVLVAHNHYRSTAPSGEDRVFENEVALLRNNEIDVVTYERYNDDALKGNRVALAFSTTWNTRTVADLTSIVRREKPDIVHFHNIWYLISPAAYYACHQHDIPIVQTLHNFRMFCANGLLLQGDHICEDCLDGHGLRSVVRGCYRGSRLHTLPVYAAQRYHYRRGTWHYMVDAYIALNGFAKEKFLHYGIDSAKVFVKPNFVADYGSAGESIQNTAIYVGRLSCEKGVNVLIGAHERLNRDGTQLKLRLVGDGTLGDGIKRLSNNDLAVVGKKPHHEVIDAMRQSSFLILPSVCYEMFPLVVAESFACGKPIIASNLGSLAELIEDGKTGLLFEPGNAQDLANKIQWMIENKDACVEMGKNARKVFEKKYTAERNFKILIDVYNTVLARKEDELAHRKGIHGKPNGYRSGFQITSRISGSDDGRKLLQGVSFLPVDISNGYQHVVDQLSYGAGSYFCFANIHVVVESHKDAELKKALNNAWGVFPDGMGTAGALKYLSHMFKGRVRGVELMLSLCEYTANYNLSIFLYGTTDETLGKLSNVLRSKYPGLNIAGVYSPPFRELNKEEDEEIVRMINKADPDILFVSLGAPKQEKWMAAHRGRIKAVQLGVGAAFDYIAGNLKEAPSWMQRHYLEWLYRMPQQPKKTLYRMSLLPEFLIRLFIQRFWK